MGMREERRGKERRGQERRGDKMKGDTLPTNPTIFVVSQSLHLHPLILLGMHQIVEMSEHVIRQRYVTPVKYIISDDFFFSSLVLFFFSSLLFFFFLFSFFLLIPWHVFA